MGVKRGWPDILLIAPGGVCHGLELKREGEQLSDDQEAFQLWSICGGAPYAVAQSLSDAIAILGAWRAIRPVSG